MKRLILLFLLLLASAPAHTQGNPTCPTRPPGDSTNACASTAFVENAVITTPPITPISSPYNVQVSDCGHVITSSGATIYTITFPAASGFPASCAVTVANLASGAFRFISSSDGTRMLNPDSSVVIRNIASTTWLVPPNERWKPPVGTYTLNVSGTGFDTPGLSDGISVPFLSVSRAAAFFIDQIDSSTGPTTPNQSQFIIQGPGGGYLDSVWVHLASHGAVGAFGSAALTIDGGSGGTILNNANGVQQFYEKARWKNIKFVSSGGNGFTCGDNSTCYLSTGTNFGSALAAQLSITTGAEVYLETDFTISDNATAGYWLDNRVGQLIINTPITVTFTQDVTYSYTVRGFGPGYSNLGSLTWDLDGHTVTTTSGFTSAFFGGHYVTGWATIPGTGSVACVNLTGAVTSDCDNVTSVNLASANVNGNLSVAHFNGGTGASSSTFLRGDGVWATTTGTTGTTTVRASGGASDCTMTFANGLRTGGSCGP